MWHILPVVVHCGGIDRLHVLEPGLRHVHTRSNLYGTSQPVLMF